MVPANQGYAAVALNLTGVAPNAVTFVTAFPGDQASAPNASNLNLVPGDVRPNMVMVGVSPTGTIKLRNDAGSVHLLVDVVGAFKRQATLDNTLTGRLAALPSPTRVVDTRYGVPIGQDATQSWNLGGLAASAPWGAGLQGVVMNATATRATAPTFLTLFPGGTVPNASTLNVRAWPGRAQRRRGRPRRRLERQHLQQPWHRRLHLRHRRAAARVTALSDFDAGWPPHERSNAVRCCKGQTAKAWAPLSRSRARAASPSTSMASSSTRSSLPTMRQ